MNFRRVTFAVITAFCISIVVAGFLTACDKKSESIENASTATVKSQKTIEKPKDIGNQAGLLKVSELVDEFSNSLPEVVASVNGVEITSKPIKKALNRYKGLLKHQNKAIDKGSLEKDANLFLDVEIMREATFQHGKKLNIEVLDEEVDKMLEVFKKRHGSEEDFLKSFSQRGLTLEIFKKEIRRTILVSKLLQKEVRDKVEISDQQALEFYENNEGHFKNPEKIRAAHILIKVNSDMKDDEKKLAKNKINDVVKRARAGKDFAELAKKYSEGPSASRGGDLNYVVRGQMVKKFEDVLFKLKVGEVSDVVETQFGYHTIKALDKKESGGKRPFNEVKKMIFEFLKKSEVEKNTKTYIKGILKKADIKRFI